MLLSVKSLVLNDIRIEYERFINEYNYHLTNRFYKNELNST